MDTRTRRLFKELKQIKDDPPDYIYLDYDEDDISHMEVLFIGPRFTPYSRMFMRFSIDFPKNYPIKPPKIQFTSSYQKKIHPNVFPGGWICLSTLNTGDSSGWVPSINLISLLRTVYSMFTKEMIEIDNTHDYEKGAAFFPAVMYDTFYITNKLLHQEQNPKLKEIMHNYFFSHKEWYLRKLRKLADEHDGKTLKNYYNCTTANFRSILNDMEKLIN